MLRVNAIKRRDLIGLALVLFCAMLTRFIYPGVVEFRHDEAMLSLMAQDAADGDFPLTGIPSSVGIPNSPVSVYVMALPYALTSDPFFATAFVAALNVIGVGLLWLLAHRYFSPCVALFAGVIYAVSPWAALYSRKIWAQDFHTPFVLMALLLGLYGFGENANSVGKRWAQMLCLPVFLLALQIHFAALALLPLYAVLLWIGRKQISWPALAISLLLTALTLVPFALGLAQTLDQDPNRLTNMMNRRGDGLSLSPNAALYTAQLATGIGLEQEISPENPDALNAALGWTPILWSVLGIATLFGLLARDFNLRLRLLIVLWALLPLIVFTPTWTTVYRHYFIASIPAYCLFVGLGMKWLFDRVPSKPLVQAVFLGILAGAAISQAVYWAKLLHYVDMNTVSGFGTPLHFLLDVRDELAQHDDVLIVTDGIEILYDQEPAIWSVMLRDSAACVRAISGGFAIFPDHPFAAVIAPNARDSALDGLYMNDEAQMFPLRPDEGTYTISTFDTAPEWDAPALTPIAPTRFDNGAQLVGYHLEPSIMFLEWALPGRVEGDHQYFGHFIDTNGEKIGQRDSSFWPGHYWCAGDRLITSIDIALPQGTETLRVGMYRFERGGFVNSSVIDDAGNPVSTWVDIPLTESQSS